MIVDTLERADLYYSLHAGLRAGLSFLRDPRCATLQPGRTEIDGDRLIAILQDYRTKLASECVWESHRRYIDIQYIVAGIERMGWAPFDRMRVCEHYDAAKEAAFHEGDGDFVTVHAGMFTIFFPSDVHKPGMAISEPTPVRKIVLKVAVNY